MRTRKFTVCCLTWGSLVFRRWCKTKRFVSLNNSVLLKTEMYFPAWNQICKITHSKKRGTDIARGKLCHTHTQAIWFSEADSTRPIHLVDICREVHYAAHQNWNSPHSGSIHWKYSVNRSSLFHIDIFHLSASSYWSSLSPSLLFLQEERKEKRGRERREIERRKKRFKTKCPNKTWYFH